jgi:hypothetical protein
MERDIFASDLAAPFSTMNRRPFDHGRPSGHYGRNMQDHATASAMGWDAA